MMAWFRLRWVKFALVAALSFGGTWVVVERAWPSPAPGASACHPSYPTLCLPENDRDWNCPDLRDREFPVLPPDPYQLDGDGDGVGCE